MSLVGKLKKFSIVPALVLASISINLSAQKQTSSVRELYYPNGVKNAYNEMLVSDFKKNISTTISSSLITPNNLHLKEKFPMCSGGEIEFSTKILKNLYANASFGLFNGKEREETQRKIKGSIINLGGEYYPLKNTKTLSIQGGLAYKSQEITGQQNGFPRQIGGIGPYIGVKIELPILPNQLSLYLSTRGNKIGEIGDSRLILGIKLNPK